MANAYRIERVRLYPTTAQRRQLENYAGAHRWTWNWALAVREAHFAAHQTSLSYYEQNRALTVLQQQPDTVWLVGIPRRVKVGALRDLDKAYRAAFRRVQRGERPGFPRFKARKRGDASFEIPAESRFDGRRVKIPGIGWIRARGGRDVATATTTARYVRDGAGDWWAALRYTVPLVGADPSDVSAIGVHLEPGHAMTLSTGETVNASRYVSRSDRKLRRLKRAVRRTQPGSGNQQRARRRFARATRHVANQRRDWQHTISRRLVDSYPRLVMQERGTTARATAPESQRAVWGDRTRRARVSDATWGGLTRLIREKAAVAGCSVAIIPSMVPTDVTCCQCGHVRETLPELVNIWLCERCGTLHERGTNAARNVLSVGVRENAHSERRREAPGDAKRLWTHDKTPAGAGEERLASASRKQ